MIVTENGARRPANLLPMKGFRVPRQSGIEDTIQQKHNDLHVADFMRSMAIPLLACRPVIG
ncbi:MAG: hypothetical protein H7Z43_10570 [Clostridia bacterium]|nr:hypothetical protein [Deltaproteobacteria bacterium]